MLGDLEVLLWPVLIFTALLFSLLVTVRLSDARIDPVAAMKARFFLGVPWGSVVILLGVIGVYLFVQSGLRDLTNPVFLPFVNWSYLYPTGVILAPFTHGSYGHLISNVLTGLVLLPVAEYIYGHYRHNDPWQLKYSRRDHPLVRALVIFPGAVLLVAMFSSLFAWGPVIGFSGVVFAAAGFAVIKFPILTIILLFARSVILRVIEAMLDPVVVAEAREVVQEPGWVGVSFQGHAIGFLLGAVLCIILLHHRRNDRPASAWRLWIGLVVIGIAMSLWAIWFGRGGGQYVLYQGVGVTLVFLGVGLVIIAAKVSPHPAVSSISWHHVAILGVVCPLLVISLAAVPMNMMTVVDYDRPDESITVDSYDVFYSDDIETSFRSAIGILDTDSPTTTSGVIVVSEERHLWMNAKRSSDLAREGSTTISLGGIATRTDVTVDRHGWTPIGNDTVYQVDIATDDESKTSFTAAERTADATIAGYVVGIAIIDEEFVVFAEDDAEERYEADMPETNESVTLGELTIERDEQRLLASSNDTTVTVAQRTT